MKGMKSYYGFRIDTNKIDYFFSELMEGRLRQGWGWDYRQDLRNFQLDKGARRNFPMFHKVKKGDYLFVPQLPQWGKVGIVQATHDWNTSYEFRIDDKKNDYGHIFPAKYIKSFTRLNENVGGNIRKTLRTPMRFWTMNHFSDEAIKLINASESELNTKQDHRSRMESIIGTAFNQHFEKDAFSDSLFASFNEQFTSSEWEFALVEGLSELFPFYQIDRTGGKEEKNHGTDVLIRMPSLLSDIEYGIAIQIKDHQGVINDHGINQIKLADKYWKERNIKIIDKWLLVTQASKEHNQHIVDNDESVKIIMAEELKELLNRIALKTIGVNENSL